MAYLILPSRRKRQPQTVARLNPALEFAGFWLPSIGTINLVNSESGTLNGGATIQPRSGGKAYRLNGTGNTVTLIPTSSTLLPTTQGVTFAFSGTVITRVANGDFGILNSGAPVGERCGCHFPFTDGTVYFDYGGATNGSTRAQVASLTFAESDVFVFSVGARGMEIWQNGVLRASNGANPSRSASSSGWGLGGNNSDGASASPNAVWTAVGMTRRQLSSSICAQLSSDLWGTAFVPDPRRIYFGAGAGGGAVTGTLAGTDGADLAAFSGSHTAPSVTGTLSATDGADSAAFSGSHTQNATGTLAATDGADLGAFTGAERFIGTLAATDGADSAAFSGSSVNGVSGTLAATDGADLAAFVGTQTVVATGTLAATDGADSAAFVGIFLQNITGTLAAVDGADSAEFSGAAAGTVTGTLAATDGADSAYIYYLATDAPDVSKLIDRDTLRLGSMPPVKRRGVTTYGTGRISKPRLG